MDPESIFFSENNVKMLYTLIHQNLETKFNCELPQDIILDGVKQVMVQVFNNRTNFVIINNSMTSQKYNMILNKKVLDISLETLPTMLNYKKSELPLSFRQESSQTGYETNISQVNTYSSFCKVNKPIIKMTSENTDYLQCETKKKLFGLNYKDCIKLF